MFVSKLISIVFFLLFTPVMFLIGIIILIDDGWPIFFFQKRIGYKNANFNLIKFRTMNKDMEDIPTHLLNPNNCIYTRSGPFLRKFSLDEIPQLINIFKGHMKFIGPRPALFNQKDLITLRTESGVHKIFPGITGWAQINGRDEITVKEKVQLDKFYLTNQSILLDIKIMLLTFFKVLKADGVSS